MKFDLLKICGAAFIVCIVIAAIADDSYRRRFRTQNPDHLRTILLTPEQLGKPWLANTYRETKRFRFWGDNTVDRIEARFATRRPSRRNPSSYWFHLRQSLSEFETVESAHRAFAAGPPKDQVIGIPSDLISVSDQLDEWHIRCLDSSEYSQTDPRLRPPIDFKASCTFWVRHGRYYMSMSMGFDGDALTLNEFQDAVEQLGENLLIADSDE